MNKYIDMMESQQVEWEMAAKESNSPQECRHCFATAADWRAIREAWEAMVESLEEVMQFIPYEKADIGTRPMWIVEIESKATAALAKARAK